jgi:ABC-type glutathione transport system ATPase component
MSNADRTKRVPLTYEQTGYDTKQAAESVKRRAKHLVFVQPEKSLRQHNSVEWQYTERQNPRSSYGGNVTTHKPV